MSELPTQTEIDEEIQRLKVEIELRLALADLRKKEAAALGALKGLLEIVEAQQYFQDAKTRRAIKRAVHVVSQSKKGE